MFLVVVFEQSVFFNISIERLVIMFVDYSYFFLSFLDLCLDQLFQIIEVYLRVSLINVVYDLEFMYFILNNLMGMYIILFY